MYIEVSTRWRMIVPIACLFVACALRVSACYSGLTLIPTAETVGADQYAVTLEVDGSIPEHDADTYLVLTQLGIGEDIEVGMDFDLSEDADPRVLLDAKYVFARSGEGDRAAAVGICNIGNHLKSSPYLTALADFDVARGHLGAMRSEGNTRWFAGFDRALNDRWTLMADYVSGDENFSALGANYQLTDNASVFAAAMFPNEGGDTRFTVQYSFGGAYRRDVR